MTLATTVLLGIIYPVVVTGIAQLLYPRQANGELIRRLDGTVVGSTLLGQPFTSAVYFHSRPSAAGPAGYDPMASGGSNLGPTNKALVDRVAGNVQSLSAENAGRTNPRGPCNRIGFRARSAHFTRVGGIPSLAGGTGAQNKRRRSAWTGSKTHRAAATGISRRAACERARTQSRTRCHTSASLARRENSTSRHASREVFWVRARSDTRSMDRCGCSADAAGPARFSFAVD